MIHLMKPQEKSLQKKRRCKSYEDKKTTNRIATKKSKSQHEVILQRKRGRNLKLMSQHRRWKNRKTIMSRHETKVATSIL